MIGDREREPGDLNPKKDSVRIRVCGSRLERPSVNVELLHLLAVLASAPVSATVLEI